MDVGSSGSRSIELLTCNSLKPPRLPGSVADTPCVAKCGARNETHPFGICQKPVTEAGLRCHLHQGKPRGGPKSPKTTTRRAPTRSPRRAREPRPQYTWQAPPPIPVQRAPSRAHSEAPRRARPENLTTRESSRVEQAVAFVADTATAGWREAVTDQALGCITPKTWERLFDGHRQQECKVLADMAKGHPRRQEGVTRLHRSRRWPDRRLVRR